ncbi:MAG: acetylglutamate kinase, partial [Pseudanabaenaceae cyanobacterium]
VGEVASVRVEVLESLLANGHIPVVSSVATDDTGQAYNINADTVAGELAAALGAEKLILLTDIAGILRDKNDPSTLIRVMDIQEARRAIESGIVAGGMIPKVQCCVRSLAQGVRAAHIIDGRVPHSLLLEIFSDGGVGSMLLA